jgi:hypothetical protein
MKHVLYSGHTIKFQVNYLTADKQWAAEYIKVISELYVMYYKHT